MTRKSSRSSSGSASSSGSGSSRSNAPLTLGGLITTVLLVIAAAVISQLTGGAGTPTATPTTRPVVSTATPTAAGATAASPGQPGTAIAAAANWFSYVFSAPTGSSDFNTYVNGPDTVVAAAIRGARQSVDVAAFELNSPAIASALLDRHAQGVRVRIVTDDEHGLDVEMYEQWRAADEDGREDIEDRMETPPDDTRLDELYEAGIPIVDDDRRDLMHNKFIILDSETVWTGSMNLTINDSYRNNNSFFSIRSQRMVQNYQAEFNEMFVDQRFGPRSPRNTPFPQFSVDGTQVAVYFAPEDAVVPAIVAEIQAAQRSIRFLAFSFTSDPIGSAMIARGSAGISVQGVFERTGSQTAHSEMQPLFCAGYDVRQDGNRYILHHKVIIIDDATVMVGSFNFSASATDANDENLVIIHNADIVARYVQEFNARYAEATRPTITCP